MKRFFLGCFIFLGFISCDDGDIIITSFDFDEITLQKCGDVGDYVFFKINNVNLETLSLQLRTQDSILTTVDTFQYPINSENNVVNYRTYNGEVPVTYFCNSIPPTTPGVSRDFVSTQGTVTVFTTLVDFDVDQTQTEDTTFNYRTVFTLNDIRLVSNEETITQEVLELGAILTSLSN